MKNIWNIYQKILTYCTHLVRLICRHSRCRRHKAIYLGCSDLSSHTETGLHCTQFLVVLCVKKGAWRSLQHTNQTATVAKHKYLAWRMQVAVSGEISANSLSDWIKKTFKCYWADCELLRWQNSEWRRGCLQVQPGYCRLLYVFNLTFKMSLACLNIIRRAVQSARIERAGPLKI